MYIYYESNWVAREYVCWEKNYLIDHNENFTLLAWAEPRGNEQVQFGICFRTEMPETVTGIGNLLREDEGSSNTSVSL
jgi:hypothetical protein